jgi:hypothetical protein
VFFENLRKKVSILFVLLMEKASIYPLLALDKNFGMGNDYPVAWCKNIGNGKTFTPQWGMMKPLGKIKTLCNSLKMELFGR